VSYLNQFINYERRDHVLYDPEHYSLDSFRSWLARLGNPQLAYPAIHVAGTKGKGSVCAFIQAIARAAGLRTGLYTSPHLIDVRERIRVDAQLLNPQEFARLAEYLRLALQPETRAKRYRTYFEVLTAMAFVYFRERAVDLAVIEVGMGGRLDSTNVLVPACSVITAIGLDHTESLGATVSQIAAEKAGIIKPNTPTVIGPQPHLAARDVLLRAAAAAGSPVVTVGDEWRVEQPRMSQTGSVFFLVGPNQCRYEAFVALPGEFQVFNALTAWTAFWRYAQQRGLPWSAESALDGLRSATWPGRLQVIRWQNKTLVVDGAHNAEAAETLVRSLAILFTGMRLSWIIALSRNKDAAAFFEKLAALPGQLICTRFDNPRAANQGDLCGIARAAGFAPLEAPTLTAAMTQIEPSSEVVVITGSLYLAGEALALYAPDAINQ